VALTAAVCMIVFVAWFGLSGATRTIGPFRIRPVQQPTTAAPVTSLKRIYPYSIVPGGVHSTQEVADARTKDPVVARHYQDLSVTTMRVQQVDTPRQAYMSYRIGGQVYWTKKMLPLYAGEEVLTDGTNTIRGRCGNRLSDTAMMPTSDDEPPAAVFDVAMDGTPGQALNRPPALVPPAGVPIAAAPPVVTPPTDGGGLVDALPVAGALAAPLGGAALLGGPAIETVSDATTLAGGVTTDGGVEDVSRPPDGPLPGPANLELVEAVFPDVDLPPNFGHDFPGDRPPDSTDTSVHGPFGQPEGPPVAVTPEPASLTLLGTGAVWFAARFIRQR